MTSRLPLLGFVNRQLQGTLGASQPDQGGAQSRVTSASVPNGLLAFFLAAGQLSAQCGDVLRLIHTLRLNLAGIGVLGKGLPT
jgi:hypothetical protein